MLNSAPPVSQDGAGKLLARRVPAKEHFPTRYSSRYFFVLLLIGLQYMHL
jgi:hypothetical protein